MKRKSLFFLLLLAQLALAANAQDNTMTSNGNANRTNEQVPYTENFDSYTGVGSGTDAPATYPNDPLPSNWQFLNRCNDLSIYSPYPQAFITENEDYAVEGNCLFFKSHPATPIYAILPEFAEDISGCQLQFTYRNAGTSNYDGTLYVGYMTDPDDASTFVQTLACPKTVTLTPMAAYFIGAPHGSYMAFKYIGSTIQNAYLSIDNVLVEEAPSCIPTGKPTCGELSVYTAKLSWDLVDPTQNIWEVQYSTSPEFSEFVTATADTHEDFMLTGLESETQYYARVRAKCGETDFSDLSETLAFTTLSTCPVPTNLAANNLTAQSAELSWTGSIYVESYDIRYRGASHVEGNYEQFNTTDLPDGWECKSGLLNNIMAGEGLSNPFYQLDFWKFDTGNGVFDNHAYLNVHGESCDFWLITDSHTIESSDDFTFDLALSDYYGSLIPATTGTDDRFVVLITTDNCQSWTILREWNNTGSEFVYNNIVCSAMGERVSFDLSGYVGQTVRIAFYGESLEFNANNRLHIDNVAFGTPVVTPWQTISGIAGNQETAVNSAVLSNLNDDTEYEMQVKSNCSNPEVWSSLLVFKTPEAPEAPTGIQVVENSITATGAAFTWDGGQDESFQYCTVTNPSEGFEPAVWTDVQGNTVALQDAFTPNRVARFYLRKDCGDVGFSKYSYVEFLTGCGPMVLSFYDDNDVYFEDFEGYEGTASNVEALMPNCWDGFVTAGMSPQVYKISDFIAHDNDNTMALALSGNVDATSYVALPQFQNPISAFTISFKAYVGNGGKLEFGYITEDDVNYNTFHKIEEYTDKYPDYVMTPYSVDLSDIPAEATRLVFKWRFPYGEQFSCIDDVKVALLPTCQPPTGLAVGNVTSTSARLTWDADDDETFQYFIIMDPPTDFKPTRETVWTEVQGNTLSFTDAFEPNSIVRFYIRKDCGDGGYSEYTSVQFLTRCTPISIAHYTYTENFDEFTVDATWFPTESIYPFDPMPDCWRFLNRPEISYHYPQVFVSKREGFPVEGNCLIFSSNETTPIYAILPEFVEDISGFQLQFTYRNEQLTNTAGTLYVGYMTDPDDASTFVQTLACPQTVTLTPMTVYFFDAPEGSYMAFKYAAETFSGQYLSIDNVLVKEVPSCFPTGNPTCGELSANTAKLSWDLVDPTQTSWYVMYSKTSDFSSPSFKPASSHENFKLTGLEPETTYYVRVYASCGDESSEPSQTLTFTTLSYCPVPTNLAAGNLTQESAEISWTGSIDVDSYAVRYHRTEQAVGLCIDEHFKTIRLPEGWESKCGLLSDISEGAALEPREYWGFGYSGAEWIPSAYIYVAYENRKDWLITKNHTLGATDVLTFDMCMRGHGPDGTPIQTNGIDDRFVVLITSDDEQTWNILREWNNTGSEYIYNEIFFNNFGQVSIDVSRYVGQTVRIAFYVESTVDNAYNWLSITNVFLGTKIEASETQTISGILGNQETAVNSVSIPNLAANTEYEVQVKSECSDPEAWSEPFTFRTLDSYMKVFVGGSITDADAEGDLWSNPDNWVPVGVPTIDQGVELRANVTIPSGCVATANQIEGDYLTIEDGGQLQSGNPFYGTLQKSITGYGEGNESLGKDWYLIASPTATVVNQTLVPIANDELEFGKMDFYRFDQSYGLEWVNVKNNGAIDDSQVMSAQVGYLYARQDDKTVNFSTGEAFPATTTDIQIPDNQLQYCEGVDFAGWNLVGNPFTCNAYLKQGENYIPFYRMNAAGDRIVLAADDNGGSTLKPCEGVFVQVTPDAYGNMEPISFTTTAPNRGNSMDFSVSKAVQTRDGVSTGSTTAVADRVRIAIGEGRNLGHLDLMADPNRLYIPMKDNDYAVVSSQPVGELPLNFEAANDGTFTLSFENATEGLLYCHLIDNLTGADVDLLSPAGFLLSKGGQGGFNEPRHAEYTFNAKTTDYASRFKVVFASTGSATDGPSTGSETFAFENSGKWIILNEGRATLQVIDMTGRILSSEQINGSTQTNIHQPSGIYLLRLVNGDDVKVQKVVVR